LFPFEAVPLMLLVTGVGHCEQNEFVLDNKYRIDRKWIMSLCNHY